MIKKFNDFINEDKGNNRYRLERTSIYNRNFDDDISYHVLDLNQKDGKYIPLINSIRDKIEKLIDIRVERVGNDNGTCYSFLRNNEVVSLSTEERIKIEKLINEILK